MDLGTIEKKLQSRAYTNGADEFVRDVRLVWSNAIRRVPPHTATLGSHPPTPTPAGRWSAPEVDRTPPPVGRSLGGGRCDDRPPPRSVSLP